MAQNTTNPPSQSPCISIIPQGGTIQRISASPSSSNVVLSFPSADLYRTHNAPYFSETIGRVANRISGAKLSNLNGGQTYPLHVNDNGKNCLHGGRKGWGKKTFDGPVEVERGGRKAELWKYLSESGEEGFPGRVELRVWYTVFEESQGRVVLEAEYEAEMVGEQEQGVEETVVAVTNHTYFNPSSNPTVEGIHLTLHATHYLPIDNYSIPTGAISPLTELLPDVPASKPITFTSNYPKLDHCLIMPHATDPSKIPLDTRNEPVRAHAHLHSKESGLNVEVASTEPAFQVYTGDGIDVPAVGKGFKGYGPRAGVAIEPSRFVDAASGNRPDDWRNMVRLKKGDVYGSRIRWSVWKDSTVEP
ncbi:MAG: hypothetical protein M1831_006777 [Alyxoria varia]|nr:MAG: hypothetical protein M1831_006777 [Alyxoria varia]